MDFVLDTSCNRREEEDVIIDYFDFEDELDVVIADYGDNISDNNINNSAVLS